MTMDVDRTGAVDIGLASTSGIGNAVRDDLHLVSNIVIDDSIPRRWCAYVPSLGPAGDGCLAVDGKITGNHNIHEYRTRKAP